MKMETKLVGVGKLLHYFVGKLLSYDILSKQLIIIFFPTNFLLSYAFAHNVRGVQQMQVYQSDSICTASIAHMDF